PRRTRLPVRKSETSSMPIILSSTQPVTVATPPLGQANYFGVLGFGYDAPVGAIPSLSIRWGKGYQSSSGANVQWIQEGVTLVTGTDLATISNTLVTAGDTLYANIKAVLYAYLQSKGIFPGGTVT
ncbi:MAG: hypothetical protein KGI71_04175, partial [Patescibacteria group bacterium]|nr:hypothetical protein [Patescibacteria group bacterium]